MKTKLFEIRDKGTFIPVVCMRMRTETKDKIVRERERYLLGRLGFGEYTHLIQLIWIGRQQTNYDPTIWDDRTMQTAHEYITKNWNLLKSGEVIDVEYILGESDEKKISERLVKF